MKAGFDEMKKCNNCDKEFDDVNIFYEEVYYGVCPFCGKKLLEMGI